MHRASGFVQTRCARLTYGAVRRKGGGGVLISRHTSTDVSAVDVHGIYCSTHISVSASGAHTTCSSRRCGSHYLACALKADEAGVAHGSPLRICGTAVRACVVAIKALQLVELLVADLLIAQLGRELLRRRRMRHPKSCRALFCA